MSSSLGIYASQMSGHLTPASSYTSIATVTVGSGGTSTVTFSSIPSTYTHLQIRLGYRSSSAAAPTAIMPRFNSDTTANYAYHYLKGDGATATAGATTSTANGAYLVRSSGSGNTNIFGSAIIDILDYTNTNKYKTSRALWGYDLNGSGQIGFSSELWQSTAAITTIDLYLTGDTAAQYSTFALYGVN